MGKLGSNFKAQQLGADKVEGLLRPDHQHGASCQHGNCGHAHNQVRHAMLASRPVQWLVCI